MHIVVKHNASITAAKTRIEQALSQARPHLGEQAQDFQEHWEGNVLHFSVKAQGHTITGTCDVTDTEYVIDAKLPLMWRLFEGKLERMLQDEIAKRAA